MQQWYLQEEALLGLASWFYVMSTETHYFTTVTAAIVDLEAKENL